MTASAKQSLPKADSTKLGLTKARNSDRNLGLGKKVRDKMKN